MGWLIKLSLLFSELPNAGICTPSFALNFLALAIKTSKCQNVLEDPTEDIKYLSEKDHERNMFIGPVLIDKLVEASQLTRGKVVMAYHLLDIFEVRTGKDQVRAERVSQVMVMEVVEAYKLTYPAPGLVEAFERGTIEVAEYKLCILYLDPFAIAHMPKMVAPVK